MVASASVVDSSSVSDSRMSSIEYPDRVAREHRQRDGVVVALPGQAQHRLGVGRRVRERGVVRACSHADESVPVGGVEVHVSIVAPTRGATPWTAYPPDEVQAP